MPRNRVFLFLCLLFVLVLGSASPALAGYPASYEKAKAQFERLEKSGGKAQEWQNCADAFRRSYQNNPNWRLRAAALYRCGLALEGKAGVTKNAADARSAVSAYEELVRKHPEQSLADDALFRAAVVCNERLGEVDKAAAALDRIARDYRSSDHAKAAADYRKKLKKGGKALPAAPVAVTPPARTGMTLAAQLGLTVRTVVIDAGHGGKDPGTMNNGVVERDVTLDIARSLKVLLEKDGFRVRLTREGNRTLTLSERVVLGRRYKGDLFVSIHVNACANPAISGMETYILDFARTSTVSRLARVENAGSARLGDMDKIVRSIVTGARINESRELAEEIQKHSVRHMKNNGRRLHSGGVKGAPFFVLVGATMPSVLVEVGYCTNKKEAEDLKSAKYRQLLAQGIHNGILAYAQSLKP
ncbi:N-acetylmuramoyl-L-alanine amidase [uncultured Mailhella sp.]|uniref:N-acetylmuramoyl-L-alanine amidase n=1 Tax=uncultured Mailhella sp. TaxID=1981031 RepID=UPI002614BBB5|nr:N-acetylmuramoyl-L-alanine amidase [uncultured Mailhella sp.]